MKFRGGLPSVDFACGIFKPLKDAEFSLKTEEGKTRTRHRLGSNLRRQVWRTSGLRLFVALHTSTRRRHITTPSLLILLIGCNRTELHIMPTVKQVS